MAGRAPYLLKQLEESGWDLARIGRTIGQPETKVRAYRRGYVAPDSVTMRQIDRMVSALHRRMMPAGAPVPQIVPDAEPGFYGPHNPHPLRGVYLEEISTPGQTWHKMVDSTGEVSTVHLANRLVDAGLFDNLVHRLETRDRLKQRALQAI